MIERTGAKEGGIVVKLEHALPKRDTSPLAGLTLPELYGWAHDNGLFIKEFTGSRGVNNFGITAFVGNRNILGIGTPAAATPEFLLRTTVPGFGKTSESAVKRALDAYNAAQEAAQVRQPAEVITFRPRR